MVSLSERKPKTPSASANPAADSPTTRATKSLWPVLVLEAYGYGYLGGRSVSIPPLTAALEFGVHENFSVGPYVGYASWNYDYTSFNYSWNFLAVGARGSFHYVPVLNEALDLSLDEEKLDFYVSLLVGMEFQTFSGDSFGGMFGDDLTTTHTSDWVQCWASSTSSTTSSACTLKADGVPLATEPSDWLFISSKAYLTEKGLLVLRAGPFY